MVRFHKHRARNIGAQAIARKAFALAKKNSRTLRHVVSTFHSKSTDANTTFVAAVNVIALFLPNGGSGKKLLVKEFNLNFEVKQNLTSVLSDNWRVDLLLDRKPDEALATNAEIYGETSPTITDYMADDEGSRFRLIRSWSGILNESTSIGRIIRYKKKMNIIQMCDPAGTFGTQAAITKNQFLLCVWGTATANVPTLIFNFQYVFEDEDQ